ncbi:MAG: enoyl-CoA hydratase/isomerase family protein [Legionellales bacterium]|nr:enoyl-CoA hydratase/isomerase family protein [Legionellales bacterium]
MEIDCTRLTHSTGDLGLLTLQRGQSLNALTYSMIKTLNHQLAQWQVDDSIKAVVIQSADPKAFCAGGDIRRLYQEKLAGNPDVFDFFTHEYTLNYRIARYPKPYIALLNGITMGGGVGISLHGCRVVATENLRFAMPETQIGFFPDIGSSYLLARCPGALGSYLALTGIQLNQADCVYAGLIQYSLAADDLPALLDTLQSTKGEQLDQVLSEANQPTASSVIEQHQSIIDQCFHQPTVTAIFEQLEIAARTHEWAAQTLAMLHTKSPTSLVVALTQLQLANTQTLAQCLTTDYRLAHRFLTDHDFFEGVRALLIDKCKQPQWQPSQLNKVDHRTIEQYFAPLSQELELSDDNLAFI